MINPIEQGILNASGIAYLLADPNLIVCDTGGSPPVIAMLGARAGQPLLDVLPELYGSETTLDMIIAGQLERLHLPEINREHRNGEVCYLDLLTLPHTDDHGAIIGVIQVITDMSERGAILQARVQQRNEYRLLKEQVSQQNIDLARTNAELRRATQLKDEFLAGISHEVRTPLTAILGLAEVTRAGLVGALNPLQIENIQGIEESGRHLLALINDFLDIAKIESGRLELELSPVPVYALCQTVVRMIAETAARKHIPITLNIAPDVNLLYGDDRRLRQVLLNLLSNAIKFTPVRGAVGLEVRGDPQGEVAYLSVWDTGIGITASDAQRLFQPFVQIPGAHQDDQRGSGLGLTLVAQLIEMHGGGVTLESEVGRGSRFTIALPWSPAREQILYTQVQSQRRAALAEMEMSEPLIERLGNGRQVLLVEDDPASAALLTNYLQRCDYSLIYAKSAEEALACVREQVPDLVVTDVRMHGMGGLELMRRLRNGIATRHLPIIALTALAMPGDRERCLEAGASAYLSKPLPLRWLATTMTKLCNQAVGR